MKAHEKNKEKEINIPFTSDELRVLEVCIGVAENAEVGSKIRERFYNAVNSLKTKLIIAQLSFESPTTEKRSAVHINFD